MINTEDAVKFIETRYKTKLYDYQVKLLDNIIHGKITNTPRCCGKSFIIKGYSEYLDYLHDICKHDTHFKADDYISGEEVLNCHNPLLNINQIKSVFVKNPDKARREYNIDFITVCTWDK